MRRHTAFALVVTAAGCAAPTATDAPPSGEDAAPAGELVQDGGLRLVAELKGPASITAGSRPSIEVALLNTSKTTTYRVVKVGEGSYVGRGEPHVNWTGTIDSGDGARVPLSHVPRGGCGNTFDYWPDNAVALPPGARLVQDYPSMFEYQRAGRVRLVANYAYKGGGPDVEKQHPPEAIAFMKGVEPFELVSNPVEFEVVRPLDLQVRVRRPVKVNEVVRLSEVLDVRLVNTGRQPIRCPSPDRGRGTSVCLEIDGGQDRTAIKLSEQNDPHSPTRTLQLGESVGLLGPGGFSNGIDGAWSHPRVGRVRLRAVYRSDYDETAIFLRSEWAEVVVTE